MAIRFKAWMLGLMCCLSASPVMAQNENAYINFNVGQSKSSNACKSPWITLGTACNEGNIAYRLAAGYQYTPALGLEVSYGDLGYADSKGTTAGTALTGPGSFTWSMKIKGWAIVGTGTLNMGDRFSLFGKVGGVRAEFNEDYNLTATNGNFSGTGMTNTAKNHLAFGIGAQFNLDRKTALRVQYENFGTYDVYSTYGATTPKIKLAVASGGIVFKF